MIDAHVSGDVEKATEIHQQLLPVFTGMFRTQGVITTKAALALQGLPAGPSGCRWSSCPRGDRAAQDRPRRRRGTALRQTSQLNTKDRTIGPDNSKCTNDMHATCLSGTWRAW